MENQQNKALTSFRKEIDQIDDEIISLLKKRMQIILKVGELKKENNEYFFIKSAREADMIKDLIKKTGSDFPPSVIVNIWRKIITAANMSEQPIAVGVHNPSNSSEYNFLIKEYYNNQVPIYNFDSATNVVLEMEKGEVQIGAFLLPQDGFEEGKKEEAKENWWISLANNRSGLNVFAKIPFVKFSNEEKNLTKLQLVLVAKKQPEKSKEDNSLLYVEVSKEVSRSQILQALKENGLQGKILKSVLLQQVEGIAFYLIELQNFYLSEAEEIQNFSKSKIKPYIKIIGHYALPIVIEG